MRARTADALPAGPRTHALTRHIPRTQVDLPAGERVEYKYVILEQQARARTAALMPPTAAARRAGAVAAPPPAAIVPPGLTLLRATAAERRRARHGALSRRNQPTLATSLPETPLSPLSCTPPPPPLLLRRL